MKCLKMATHVGVFIMNSLNGEQLLPGLAKNYYLDKCNQPLTRDKIKTRPYRRSYQYCNLSRQFCTKSRRYLTFFDKTRLQMFCVSIEWCYAIKIVICPLMIALRERSFFKTVAFLFAFHVMPCDLNEKNVFSFEFFFCNLLNCL